MKTKDIPNKGPSDWTPLTNPHDLAVMAKLGEEAAELGSELNCLSKIIFRCIAQGGLDKSDPRTGQLNKMALEEEIADVQAFLETTIRRLDLDQATITERKNRKIIYKEPWFESLTIKTYPWKDTIKAGLCCFFLVVSVPVIVILVHYIHLFVSHI